MDVSLARLQVVRGVGGCGGGDFMKTQTLKEDENRFISNYAFKFLS